MSLSWPGVCDYSERFLGGQIHPLALIRGRVAIRLVSRCPDIAAMSQGYAESDASCRWGWIDDSAKCAHWLIGRMTRFGLSPLSKGREGRLVSPDVVLCSFFCCC